MVISISGRSVGNDRLLRNQNRHLLLNQRRQPRQRRSNHRGIDLVLNLQRDVRFDCGLIDSRSEAPAQDLSFGQLIVRSERTTRRLERRSAVASAAVVILTAVASPIGGDNDIGESAFRWFNEKAFDDPREGGHGIKRSRRLNR